MTYTGTILCIISYRYVAQISQNWPLIYGRGGGGGVLGSGVLIRSMHPAHVGRFVLRAGRAEPCHVRIGPAERQRDADDAVLVVDWLVLLVGDVPVGRDVRDTY